MGKLEKFILFLIGLIIVVSIIAAFGYYAMEHSSSSSIVINSNSATGVIGKYNYKITPAKQRYSTPSIAGYLEDYADMDNSPVYYYISAGESYQVSVKKITIKDDNLTIEVAKDAIKCLCVEAVSVSMSIPNEEIKFDTVTIKEGNTIYQEFS